MRSSGFEAVSSLTAWLVLSAGTTSAFYLFLEALSFLNCWGELCNIFFFFLPSLKLYKCFMDWEASNLKLGWGEWAVEGGGERNFLSRQFTKSSTPAPQKKKKIIAVDSSRRFLDVAPYCKVTAWQNMSNTRPHNKIKHASNSQHTAARGPRDVQMWKTYESNKSGYLSFRQPCHRLAKAQND